MTETCFVMRGHHRRCLRPPEANFLNNNAELIAQLVAKKFSIMELSFLNTNAELIQHFEMLNFDNAELLKC